MMAAEAMQNFVFMTVAVVAVAVMVVLSLENLFLTIEEMVFPDGVLLY